MFGLHMPELIVILVIALLIFGPKKLPEMGSSVGRTIKQFREGMSEMSQSKPEKELDLKALEPEALPKQDAPSLLAHSEVAPEVVNSEVSKAEIPVE